MFAIVDVRVLMRVVHVRVAQRVVSAMRVVRMQPQVCGCGVFQQSSFSELPLLLLSIERRSVRLNVTVSVKIAVNVNL